MAIKQKATRLASGGTIKTNEKPTLFLSLTFPLRLLILLDWQRCEDKGVFGNCGIGLFGRHNVVPVVPVVFQSYRVLLIHKRELIAYVVAVRFQGKHAVVNSYRYFFVGGYGWIYKKSKTCTTKE